MDLHASCPYCGKCNRLSEDTPYSTSYTLSAHAQKDELVLLNEGVGRLDGMMRQLQQRRSILLSRINNIQASACAIPAEVLSQIFLYACPRIVLPCKKPGTYRDIAPSVLAAVCSHWRQIATSTPELWATISLDKVAPSTLRRDMAVLKTSFEHAGQYPMSLSLNFAYYEIETRASGTASVTASPDHLVLETLHDHADRIGSLRVYHMPVDWINAVQWYQFSALTELRLHWRSHPWQKEERNEHLFLPNTIQELSIRCLPHAISSKLIPPAGITSLYLNGIQINKCVQLLVQCPNLLKFSSTNMNRPHPDNALPDITGTVAMAHLEELEWEWISSSWSNAFIRHFLFPVLRELRWKGLCSSTLGNLALEAFWSNLPSTLTKLDIPFESQRLSQDVASSLLQIFRHFSGIVELGIEIIPPDRGINCVAASTEGVLGALQMETSGGVNNKEYILPSLEILRWLTKIPPDKCFSPKIRCLPIIDGCSLVRMLSTRKKLGLKLFKLTWEGDINFEANHKEAMAELVASGLNIEIGREEGD